MLDMNWEETVAKDVFGTLSSPKKMTGEELYEGLVGALGSQKEASLFLRRAGIDGIKYPAGTLSGIKGSDKFNYVVFDDAAVTITQKGPPDIDPADIGMAKPNMLKGRAGPVGPVKKPNQNLRGTIPKPKATYQPRGLEDAKDMRKEGGSLEGYDARSQTEWLGGKQPPKDGKLTIYRATPTGAKIKPGDYVTNELAYAELHIKSNLGGKGRVTKTEATLDDLFPADGPKEFWYAPKSIESNSLK
jgi:hypothetical protein